jgi:glycosyltransferase involved in cell wall biosynthesis
VISVSHIPAATPAHRLAVILSHPTQYYSPWFRHIAAHTPLALRVFYLWEFGVTTQRDPQFQATFKWDVDLLSGYDHEFVPNAASDPGTHHFGGLRNPALTARLAAWRPDVLLIFGYKWRSHLQAILWARLRRIPLLFRGDSHLLGRPAVPAIKRFALKMLYRQFAGVLHVGAANRDYFRRFGVPENRLHFAPHSVDATHFDPARPALQSTTTALRESLGLSPRTRVVVFAGKFVPDKNPVGLLDAFLELAHENTALVFVGDGPEKARLQEMAARALPGAVHFLPFANQSEMPARLALADIVALPSRGFHETWGLVVNEAMHLGTPALVSDRVGSQRDLVTDGETGWVCAAGSADSLRQTLGRALLEIALPARREQLRSAARTRISRYTYAESTAGLLRALDGIPATRSA